MLNNILVNNSGGGGVADSIIYLSFKENEITTKQQMVKKIQPFVKNYSGNNLDFSTLYNYPNLYSPYDYSFSGTNYKVTPIFIISNIKWPSYFKCTFLVSTQPTNASTGITIISEDGSIKYSLFWYISLYYRGASMYEITLGNKCKEQVLDVYRSVYITCELDKTWFVNNNPKKALYKLQYDCICIDYNGIIPSIKELIVLK